MDTNEARAAESAKRDADRDAAALTGQILENTGKAQAVSNTTANQPFVNESLQNRTKLDEMQKFNEVMQIRQQLEQMMSSGQPLPPEFVAWAKSQNLTPNQPQQ